MTTDLGARRIVTALMLIGIAIDAAVAPLVGSALPALLAAAAGLAFAVLAGRGVAGAHEAPPGWPSSASPTPAPAASSVRPAYRPLRDEEDWRFACDPARRTDVFDGIKCIPIGTDPLRFASVSAEAREWYERYVHADWLPANPSNGYLLERYLVGADLHLDRFHAYAQLESATAAGRLGGQGTIFRDDFAATDAYVAWRFGPLDAGAAPVALIVGRQELDYGAGRIVSARDGAGVRASFDGVRAVVQTPAWRIDALDVHPVAIEPFGFDDIPAPTQTLVGAYAVRKLPFGSILELYGFDDHRATAVYARGVGPEQRYTVGARVGCRFGRLATEAEAAYQFGTFGRNAQHAIVSASSLSGSVAYTFGGTRIVPSVALGAGSGTGDTAPRSAVLRTYVPPAFRGSYLGLVQESGPANSIGFEPSATLAYAGGTTLTVGDVILAEATSADAVYNLAGFPFRAAAPGTPTALGGGPIASVAQRLDPHFTVTLGYQRFNAGAHFAAAPPSAGISYDKLVLDYKI